MSISPVLDETLRSLLDQPLTDTDLRERQTRRDGLLALLDEIAAQLLSEPSPEPALQPA